MHFDKALKLIKQSKTIAVVGHVRPDGDTVGSALTLKMGFEAMGKAVDVFIDETDGEIPKYFSYISGFNAINPKPAERYDLLIIIDSSDEKRIGKYTKLRDKTAAVLVIDHHLDNQVKADLAVINTDAASCGEILYDFFTENNIEITKEIATALFTSISSDTGCFLFPNTTAHTHFVASELLKKDIDRETILYYNFRVYDPKSINGLLRVLKEIKFVNGGRIAITYLDYRLVKKLNFDNDERHKLQKYAIDANGVRASIFITENEPGSFHISLRSHGEVNVANVAKIFGGGGHKNASGAIIQGKYKEIIKNIISEVEKAIEGAE